MSAEIVFNDVPDGKVIWQLRNKFADVVDVVETHEVATAFSNAWNHKDTHLFGVMTHIAGYTIPVTMVVKDECVDEFIAEVLIIGGAIKKLRQETVDVWVGIHEKLSNFRLDLAASGRLAPTAEIEAVETESETDNG